MDVLLAKKCTVNFSCWTLFSVNAAFTCPAFTCPAFTGTALPLLAPSVILMLDDIINALDAESECVVQAALDDFMKEPSSLVVAQRLSTVLKADRIVVLDHGRIVEQGRHEDLAAAGGLYAHLAALQFQNA